MYNFEHDGRYGMVSSQGIHLADGTQIRDSKRDDALVRRLEQMTTPQLEELIRQAEAAVQAGDVKPQRYPGTGA